MGFLDRAKKPELKQQRLKLMLYGMHGTGKSTIGAALRDCLYLDTEDIMSKPKYQRLMREKNDESMVIPVTTLDEILTCVKELRTVKHPYKTLVIDSLTVAYTNAKTLAEKTLGSKYGADSKEANKKVREICSLLLTLDMNIVITCHGKKEYDESMKLSGNNTYDGYSGLGYIFDVMLETTKTGEVFSVVVQKSRLDGFKTGTEINFSYADLVKRCGIDSIEVEREVVPQELPPPTTKAKLATHEKLEELNKLIILCGKEDEIPNWLKKAKCETLDKMPADIVDKCIKFLSNELTEEQE